MDVGERIVVDSNPFDVFPNIRWHGVEGIEIIPLPDFGVGADGVGAKESAQRYGVVSGSQVQELGLWVVEFACECQCGCGSCLAADTAKDACPGEWRN